MPVLELTERRWSDRADLACQLHLAVTPQLPGDPQPGAVKQGRDLRRVHLTAPLSHCGRHPLAVPRDLTDLQAGVGLLAQAKLLTGQIASIFSDQMGFSIEMQAGVTSVNL